MKMKLLLFPRFTKMENKGTTVKFKTFFRQHRLAPTSLTISDLK